MYNIILAFFVFLFCHFDVRRNHTRNSTMIGDFVCGAASVISPYVEMTCYKFKVGTYLISPTNSSIFPEPFSLKCLIKALPIIAPFAYLVA